MKTYIFATTNPNKREEVAQMMQAASVRVIGLDQLGFEGDIPEDQDTLEGNAQQKAEYIFDKYGEPCFSEDTGLEVEALGGQPGVHTARYAGLGKNAHANMSKLLDELKNSGSRRAQFRTVLCFHDGNETRFYEGIVTGQIAHQPTGQGGFGYDPIFVPDGFDRTFAELPVQIKNSFSHRSKAWHRFISDLSQ